MTTRERIDALLAKPRACCICGRTATTPALFVPDEPEQFGAPAGKRRFIVYGVCGRCYELPDRAERVEREIAARFGPAEVVA